MSNAVHAQRLAIALLAALALAACSQNNEVSAEDPGRASGEHGSSSSAGLPEGRVAIGEKRAQVKGEATKQSCVDCHGAEGNAPIDASYPKLGGQYADYIAHSLQAYRSGNRGGSPTTDLMGSQAKELNNQQIADLGAYFASVNGQLKDLHDAN